MSQESRGGVLEDTTTDILDLQEQEREMRPNHNQNSRRYENLNYRNTVPERPVKKILKKKKKSNAGKICSFTGVVLVILIVGAFLLVKFQKEIESKIFTLKSKEPLEAENRTILPKTITETEIENLDQRSPEKNNNSGENSSVLVKKKEQEKENISEVINEDNESELEDSEEENGITEPEPQHVPISVGANNTSTGIKSEKPQPEPEKEKLFVLPENQSFTTEHLFKAIEDGDVRMAKALIKAGVDLKKFNTEGYNTLHFAAEKLNVEIMNAILESGPGKIDIEARTQGTDLNMLTALHVVSANATLIDVSDQLAVDVARLLISHNADINSKAKDNFTPLGFAVDKSSNSELVKYLLEQGSDYKAVFNDINDNLLHLAMNSCNPDIIKLLISSGVPVDGLNSEFRQPIHDAAYLGCIAGIEKLVLQGKVDKNVTTPLPNEIGNICEDDERICCGSTPLHFAAMAGNAETVLYLLLCEASFAIKDSKGYSALDYANESTEIVEIIKKYKN